MRRIGFHFITAVMLMGINTSYCFAEKLQILPSVQITSGPIPKAGASEETFATFNISCEEQLQSNHFVISGGLSAESVSPKDGSAQLNELIEKLLKLGMDLYGKDAGVDAYSSRYDKTLIFYRIAKQDEQLAAAMSRCMRKEATTICPNLAPESCVTKIKVFSAYARTGSIVTAESYRNTLHLLLVKQSAPQRVEAIETVGTQNIPIQITIDGRVAREAAGASATPVAMSGKKGAQ